MAPSVKSKRSPKIPSVVETEIVTIGAASEMPDASLVLADELVVEIDFQALQDAIGLTRRVGLPVTRPKAGTRTKPSEVDPINLDE